MSKTKPFNNPFGALKLKQDEPKPSAKPSGKQPVSAPASAKLPKPSKAAPVGDDEDALLFLQSVGEVAPVRKGAKLVDPPPPRIDPRRMQNEDSEVLAQLSQLVADEATFELASSSERIEGALTHLDPRVLQRLRRGDYPIQGHLDLHGLTQAEAKTALERFLTDARHQRKRCVLVVHGRGLHSEGQIPVLKESVQAWLTGGRLGKWVLAFSSARPDDGGAGAVYVLLRA
jgi:DNA-nicking Smr family endonuclease